MAQFQRPSAVGGFAAFQDLADGVTGPLAWTLADRTGYRLVLLIGGIAAKMGLCVTVAARPRR